MKKAVASVTVMAWDISNVMNASGENQRIEDSMKKKIYISGKIGEETPSPETLEKFKMAEIAMRAMGYEVFNPTTSGLGKKADELAKRLSEESGRKVEWYDAIMLLDLEELAKCDAICLLDDWKDSDGASTEALYAYATKKHFIIHGKQIGYGNSNSNSLF